MEAVLVHHQEIEAENWDAFIRNSPQGSVQALYGYNQLIAPNWQAIIVRDQQQWWAVMPLEIKQKWGIRYSLQPPFSQYWGVFFADHLPSKDYSHFSKKRKILELILEKLPESRLFEYNFSPQFDYPLPFHWAGYEIRTRYTYQLNLQQEPIQAAFAPALKRQLKKAQRDNSLVESVSGEELWQLMEKNDAHGKKLAGGQQHLKQLLPTIIKWVMQEAGGEALGIRAKDGEILAAALFVGLGKRFTYLMGAIHPTASSATQMPFLMAEAIGKAQASYATFDFEGSMIEAIERFFRKFGAVPIPYLQIQKNQLPLWVRWIRTYT